MARMYVKIVGLMATLMIMGGIATAQDLPIQGTFGKAGENGLPENWEQEKGDNLKPFGKAEVIAETMETPIKAVRLEQIVQACCSKRRRFARPTAMPVSTSSMPSNSIESTPS